MPRSLVSFWKRVATSGLTADGRDILAQDLRDIAETYKPSFYTAVIWCDHERWPGSHGTVYAVRLVEEGDDLQPGEVALEAQLKPNDQLLYLNDRGQKLFTSIEITPNFRKTGKAYLTGLGVTDEPASVGTQELYFSKRSNKTAYYAASVAIGSFRDAQPQGEIGRLAAMFTRLFKHFGLEETPATPQTPTESKPPMDEATAKALQALLEQLLLVAAGIQAVIEPATSEIEEPEQAPIDDVEAAVAGIVEQAEADREFARRGNTDKRLANIESLLTKAFSTVKTRQVSRTTGPAGPAKKRVV
ncbi:capsid scaffolding protein [Pseudomonas sp. Fl5BN2]|uniref:GPO family capsid scaffolding protein n=1 Tax=Pseudomonas sp. Fl5BN2 TaxID=2697652 RepID=UPI001376A159|nr:GPO family capsid scaffolding protein [Pseudomonas sp. Fl5BN2]NBF05282.1 capsid scaffolding protein [Pseudomonas sp. Fl5BN2]